MKSIRACGECVGRMAQHPIWSTEHELKTRPWQCSTAIRDTPNAAQTGLALRETAPTYLLHQTSDKDAPAAALLGPSTTEFGI
jgi:hypothetical protein